MIKLPITAEQTIDSNFQKNIDFDVLLLSLNWYRKKDPRIPLGMAFIAAYVREHLIFRKENGLHLIQVDVRDNHSKVLHQITVMNPKIIGIGVYCWNIEKVSQILPALHTLGYNGTIILGGPEITYGNNELVIEFPDANYFVKGDGEKAFTDIITAINEGTEIASSGIFSSTSLNFDSYAKIHETGVISPFTIEDISNQLLGVDNDRFVRWQTQRGCVYRCSFCAFPNGYQHFLEIDLTKIKRDLEFFSKNDVKEVAVLDPIFFVHKERAINILNLIKDIIPECRFEIQTKLEHLDEDLLEIISCLNIVLECGIQTLDPLVQKTIRRINNREKMVSILKEIKRLGIQNETHLIYGLPHQTLESLMTDYNLLKKYSDKIRLFPLMRLRGTGFDKDYLDKYQNMVYTFSPIYPFEVMKTPWMSSHEILELKNGLKPELVKK